MSVIQLEGMIAPRVATVRRWLLRDAPACVVLGVAGLIGAVTALRAFGLSYVLGNGPFWSWPAGDAAMMLTGWNYFIHDQWHWPLALTLGRDPPQGINLLYLDAIPVVAFVGKLLRPILGTEWHPYGLWHGLLYVLQAIFAALVARRLGLRSLASGVSLALLALSTHVFLLRFYHEGLNGHFVLLWALLSYFRMSVSRSAVSQGLEWSACVGVAVLLHPYR